MLVLQDFFHTKGKKILLTLSRISKCILCLLQTLCILVQGLAVFSHLVDLFGFLRGPPTTQNPIKLYKITQDCIATFLYLTLIANCWKHKFGFKNLIGTFYRYHNLREKSTQRLVVNLWSTNIMV